MFFDGGILKMTERNMSVNLYFEINFYLCTSAYFHEQNNRVSIASINDFRQIESVLQGPALEHESNSKNPKQSF